MIKYHFSFYTSYMGVNLDGELKVMHSFDGYGAVHIDPSTHKMALEFETKKRLGNEGNLYWDYAVDDGRDTSVEEFSRRLIDRDEPFFADKISTMEFRDERAEKPYMVYGKSRILATLKALLSEAEVEYTLEIDEN